MKLIRVMMPLSAKSLPTSPIRLMFSSRSWGEKPRFLLRPCLTLSPSSRAVSLPRSSRACSSVQATVLLPDPDRPVNQRTHPFCSRRSSFCSVLTPPGVARTTSSQPLTNIYNRCLTQSKGCQHCIAFPWHQVHLNSPSCHLMLVEFPTS